MPTKTSPDVQERSDSAVHLAPLYHLVLLDDDEHSYAYVVALLGSVFGYGVAKSYALACVVDSTGRAIVETAALDQVLGHQRQIHAFGADPLITHCKGSMSALIEPVP